jgi:hypothetical protein
MIEGHVRRVFPVLLALILVPSIAMASWYRCEYDGTTRTSCCCPTSTHQLKQKAPPQSTSLRAACCCTVIQVSSAEPSVRDHQLASIDDVAPPVLTVEHLIDPASRFAGRLAVDRPRALGDPPDTLFARRCSLLR